MNKALHIVEMPYFLTHQILLSWSKVLILSVNPQIRWGHLHASAITAFLGSCRGYLIVHLMVSDKYAFPKEMHF